MFETAKVLSLNSHSRVLELEVKGKSAGEALQNLQTFLHSKEIAAPQILQTESLREGTQTKGLRLFITGPAELVKALAREASAGANSNISLKSDALCSVTATCTGATTPELTQKILARLEQDQIQIHRMQFSAMSLTVYLDSTQQESALIALHQII